MDTFNLICYLTWFLSVITKRDNFRTRSLDDEGTLTQRHFSQLLPGYQTSTLVRGRPWRYSVIPSTPDFPTGYQIRRNSNPAGLPVFAAIWGPDFRASIIILTNMFKQIKQIRITLMTMFKGYPSPANELC